jgi:hypothetical protein
MKLTIVKEDSFVSKDNNALDNIDMTGLSDNFWALHWDNNSGEVEYTDSSPETITSISAYQFIIDRFDTAWSEFQAELAANAPTVGQVLRYYRDNKLKSSDWTQLPDADITDAKKIEWSTYRQSLRDLPANTTGASLNSDNELVGVTWPTEPA